MLTLNSATRHAGTVWSYPTRFFGLLEQDFAATGLHLSERVFLAWLTLMLLVMAKYLHQMWFRLCDKDVDRGSYGTRR